MRRPTRPGHPGGHHRPGPGRSRRGSAGPVRGGDQHRVGPGRLRAGQRGSTWPVGGDHDPDSLGHRSGGGDGACRRAGQNHPGPPGSGQRQRIRSGHGSHGTACRRCCNRDRAGPGRHPDRSGGGPGPGRPGRQLRTRPGRGVADHRATAGQFGGHGTRPVRRRHGNPGHGSRRGGRAGPGDTDGPGRPRTSRDGRRQRTGPGCLPVGGGAAGTGVRYGGRARPDRRRVGDASPRGRLGAGAGPGGGSGQRRVGPRRRRPRTSDGTSPEGADPGPAGPLHRHRPRPARPPRHWTGTRPRHLERAGPGPGVGPGHGDTGPGRHSYRVSAGPGGGHRHGHGHGPRPLHRPGPARHRRRPPAAVVRHRRGTADPVGRRTAPPVKKRILGWRWRARTSPTQVNGRDGTVPRWLCWSYTAGTSSGIRRESLADQPEIELQAATMPEHIAAVLGAAAVHVVDGQVFGGLAAGQAHTRP